MNSKKIISGLLALSFVFGGAVLPSGVVSNVASVVTAQADTVEADCYSFDKETGVLTLRGEVNKNALIDAFEFKFSKSNVRAVRAEDGTVFPKDSSDLFKGLYNCTFIDLSCVDTSKVIDMSHMFETCNHMIKLDLSGFDTSNVENMYSMFYDCSSLTELDLSGFDTSNVTDMSSMFFLCESLTSLDLSRFDTKKVIYMYKMFAYCRKMTTLDLSGFDTSNVKKMNDMFEGCNMLTTIIYAPKPAYPTNIKVDYSEQYHQMRFTWEPVENAQQYGIAVYLAGKWRIQTQNIPASTTSYTTPKNLTPGKTYKVAIAAKVDGKWDTANAIKNAVTVTVK
jgi:surface protein